MIGDLQRERFVGTRWFLEERRAYARFSERMLYGLAVLVWVALPLSWSVRGFEGLGGGWSVALASLLCAALAQWPAFVRRRAEQRLKAWDASAARTARALP